MTTKTFWIAAQNPAAMTALLIGLIDVNRDSSMPLHGFSRGCDDGSIDRLDQW